LKARRAEHFLKISVAEKTWSGYSIRGCCLLVGRIGFALLDLEAPASARHSRNAGSFRVSFRSVFPIVLALTLHTIGAAQCYAKDQDVAEADRQERARKQNQQKKNKHVYTAEDLKREHVLTPEDRAQLDAEKNQPAPADARRAQDAANSAAAH